MAARAIDLSGNLPVGVVGFDRSYSRQNRILAASPVNVTVPGYTGELVLETVNNQLWTATGLTSADWTPVFRVL